jgi:hypothetical protein
MITVQGHSDDLIEVDGDITEEFYAAEPGKSPDLLAFSDGTVLAVNYTADGIWRITPLTRGTVRLTVEQAVVGDPCYSDVATLDGLVRWVVLGTTYRAAAPTPPLQPDGATPTA